MKTVENMAARAQSGRLVFVEYLSKGRAMLLAIWLQLAVSYKNYLQRCIEALKTLNTSIEGAPQSLGVIGRLCFDKTPKCCLQAILTANGIAFKKSDKVQSLVDAIHENGLCDPDLSKLRGYVGPCLPYEFAVRGGCAYRHTSVTEADHAQALAEITKSLTDDATREANNPQAETYTPTLDDDGNPIPGMKTHTLTGVGYVQGLVTDSPQAIKGYDGSPLANVYGDGIEAREAKKRSLRNGVTTAKDEIRAAIGWDRWRTLRVNRCVYIASGGHKLGNRYIENPHSTRRDTHTG